MRRLHNGYVQHFWQQRILHGLAKLRPRYLFVERSLIERGPAVFRLPGGDLQ
jgi:hypothetical protein